MKYYAAIGHEVPQHILIPILGAVDVEDGVFYTRPFDSQHHLLTLVGTVQSRMERENRDFDGACILPYGAKVPTKRAKFKVSGPLKARLDYGMGEPYQVLEMRSPYNKFYAAEQEPLQHPQTVIVTPNKYYPKGLTEHDIHAYYQDNANKIIAEYGDDLDGAILLKVDGKTVLKRHAAQEVMAMRVDANAFNDLNRGRTVEFHFAVGANTNLLWLDIDPKDLFPWEETKQVTADLFRAMSAIDEVDVMKTELRFSGKSGFHIVSHIAHPLNTDDARMVVKRVAEAYVSGRADPRITTGVTREAESVRVDYSTLHEGGGLRTAHSLAYPTGLICMPINPNQLQGFEKEMARIAAVTASASEIEVRAEDEEDVDALMLNLKELGIEATPAQVADMVEQMKRLKKMDPAEFSSIKQGAKNRLHYEAQVKSVQGLMLAVVSAISDKVNDLKQKYGVLYRMYSSRGVIARSVALSLVEEVDERIRKSDELLLKIKAKVGKAVVPVGDLAHKWLEQIGQNAPFIDALKEILYPTKKGQKSLLEVTPKGGWVAAYNHARARGQNTDRLLGDALANLDIVVDLVEKAETTVPSTTFLPKEKKIEKKGAEAVMEMPAFLPVEETVEELADQINLALTQISSDLETANLVMQDMLEDLDAAEASPLETMAALQDELERLMPIQRQYGVTIDEAHAVGKWLNIFKEELTGSDIRAILAVRDRLTTPVFQEFVVKMRGDLAADPDEIYRGLSGLEMLQGLPKYRASRSYEKFILSPHGEISTLDLSETPHHWDWFEREGMVEEGDELPWAEGWSTGILALDGSELTLNIGDTTTTDEVLRQLPPRYLAVKSLYVNDGVGDTKVQVREGDDALSAWEKRNMLGAEEVMAKTQDFNGVEAP
jgi:hypothetical protein